LLSSATSAAAAVDQRVLNWQALPVCWLSSSGATDLPNAPAVVYQSSSMTAKSNSSAVQDFLLIESKAIAQTADRLNSEQVERVIALLANCKGKVVLLGIGKSGIIAQKIAATLTSTGTPALYLHPSDALHGGLGIINSDDVVIVLSNSGETDEVILMLPYLKHRHVPIIAMVGNLNSTLARRADAVLDASVAEEACPLNLAPTTSTTVALALGDALALTLMQVKGLTPDDFAVNHPAGRLGKRLTLKVSDLMHSGPHSPTVELGAQWLAVVQKISNGGLGAVNVIDDQGRLAGVITDGDLRRAIQRRDHASLEHLRCDDFMTPEPVVALPEMLAFEALRLMEDRPSQISVLPVVDQEGLSVGLLRLHDIVRSGL
jgi:arabinose-5-phosphate isomerase